MCVSRTESKYDYSFYNEFGTAARRAAFNLIESHSYVALRRPFSREVFLFPSPSSFAVLVLLMPGS